MSTAQMGVVIIFVAISVLFGATLIGYVITRTQVEVWRTAESRGLPAGIGASTLLLVGVSGSAQWALESIRKNRHDALKRGLWLTLAFATAFLIGQAFNWSDVARTELSGPKPTMFAFTFYLLTGVHALHVIGGFVPLVLVLYRARQREYSSSRHAGVQFCAQYWHFLGIIWLILLATMWVAA